MRAPRVAIGLLLLLTAAALGARLWRLDARPMHPDEANQAVRAGILQASGRYQYDPQEHHGPSLYYLALPGAWLTAGRDFSGTTEATFRAVPAVFGAGLILMLLLVRRTLGNGAVLASAVLVAVSPAMVYFSRFFIQEMLLVFFSFGLLAAVWRYLERPGHGWAILAGFCAALMFATKETCVLAWAALAGAGALTAWLCPSWRAHLPVRELSWSHLAGALLVAAGVATTLFSSFFTHWAGVRDAVAAFAIYAGRGTGAGSQDQPWHYYLHLLGWFRVGRAPVFSEALILGLAAVGAVAAWRRRRARQARWVLGFLLACYTGLLVALYSVISYKTPWCALSFLHGMILLAGLGTVALLQRVRDPAVRGVVALLLGAGVLQLAQQAWRANTRFAADPRNPWVYAQTSTDLLRLVKRVQDVAAVHPQRENLLVAVVEQPDHVWPLPWYLRKFPRTGYWTGMEELPPDLEPAVLVSRPGQKTPLDGNCQSELYGLRPQVLLAVHIRRDAWERFLETRR